MNATLKITRIGSSADIVLPKKLLAHLQPKVGANRPEAAAPKPFLCMSRNYKVPRQLSTKR